MSNRILEEAILNGEKFLMDFTEHALERSDQRLEEEDVKKFIITLEKLAERIFSFGEFYERLVTRDFFSDKVVVFSVQETDEIDFDCSDIAIEYSSKIVVVTLFHQAEQFRQNRNERVVIIDQNNNFVNDEEAVSYNEYLFWFKQTFKRMPKEDKK
jgi:hypothetical protein